MPLFSVVMCFTFPSGIGLYWIASAVVRMIQQFAINKYLSKISIEELIEKNQPKRQRRGKRKVLMQKNFPRWLKVNARRIERAGTEKDDRKRTGKKL